MIIQFTKKDAKDSQYIKENNTNLMDAYQTYFSKTSALVTKDTGLSTVKEFQSINEDKVVSKGIIKKKYALIGFVLGALIGIVIVMAWDARKHWGNH